MLLRKQLAGKLEHELLLIQKFYRKVLHVVRVFPNTWYVLFDSLWG